MPRPQFKYWDTEYLSSPVPFIIEYFEHPHFPCLWAKWDSLVGPGPCRCSHAQIIFEGMVFTLLKILLLPLLLAYVSPLYVKQLYEKARDYETRETRRNKVEERIEQARAKKTPRILLPRIGDELFLTIGKTDDGEIVQRENGKAKGKSKGKFKRRMITDTQTNCILFRLPTEVRRLVWTEAVGGYLLHMRYVEAYKRMAFTRCKHEFGDVICDTERCIELMKQTGAKDKWGNIELLSLLQTCRRM